MDYRLLNKIALTDGYQLPNTADLLHECHGYNLFSRMDLLNGNAPGVFQGFIDAVFQQHLKQNYLVAIIDDLLVKTNVTKKDHLDRPRLVLTTIRANNLKISLNKYGPFQSCGHLSVQIIILIQYCLPSHHEGKGIAERYSRAVTLFLRMVTGENLDEANSFGYNDLNTGFLRGTVLSPADDLATVYNAIEEFAESNLLGSISKMENHGSKKRIIHYFQVGDKKLDPKYFGPFIITKVDGNNVTYSGKNKFGSDFTKTGHVQDMKHIQVSLQNHIETDMDDQDNDTVSMSDAEDKTENITALEIATIVTGIDDVETETISTDAEEREEQPLNKSNNGQSNSTDPQGSHNDMDVKEQKIKKDKELDEYSKTYVGYAGSTWQIVGIIPYHHLKH
ncbi:hypothetical protein ACTA71_012568 [Dictyostelium dimigraforme]